MSSPTLAEVIRAGIAASLESVHTAIPGKVTRYDASKQQADVQPLVKLAYDDEDGNRIAASLPVVRNCPVQFSGGGGLVMTHPVAVGDTGLLVFSEASMDKWLAGSGGEVDPELDVRMGLSDGIFIPGVKPFGASRDVPTGCVAIGTDGGSFQGAALGKALEDWLRNPIVPLDPTTLLGWLMTHGHSALGAGPPTTTAPAPPTLESGTVKITP